MARATPYQLYRLNKEGRLLLVESAPVIDHVQADLAIKETLPPEERMTKEEALAAKAALEEQEQLD